MATVGSTCLQQGTINLCDQNHIIFAHKHTGQCKSTGGCYNELVVAYFGTGGGVKWRKRCCVIRLVRIETLRLCSSHSTEHNVKSENILFDQSYPVDDKTNITPAIIQKLDRNLHRDRHHPLGLVKLCIQNFFYSSFIRRGNPMFSIYDNLNPVVTLEQNYDHLLVPLDHPSRKPSDCYYLNSEYMLRAHCTAHQRDLISAGLDCFLIVGDVFRRDSIDSSHYPVFHQVDGVRLFTQHELFKSVNDPSSFHLFEDGQRYVDKQGEHTLEAAKLVEFDLKQTLENLAANLFGKDLETRWVDAYFPFTHPSWELEIKYQNDWMEVLGCGVIEQEILKKSGAKEKIGWAFGLGLERLAMRLYNIPDIRLFWSKDSGFLTQFKVDDPQTKIKYKPISNHPQCTNDIAFWLPDSYSENDFYDLVRSVGGDLVEQVHLIDEFTHPKKQRTSHCYRLVYRHMEKALKQEEVNIVHKQIETEATQSLGVEIR